jgi:hypothetical protein
MMNTKLQLTASDRNARAELREARLEPREEVLPLWLTEQEAEAVLEMCAAAVVYPCDDVDAALFQKLGHILRTFRH